MSEENVEIVRRAFEAWNEGGPEAVKQFMAEEFELHDILQPFPTRGWGGAGMASLPI